ncbi:MAG TPA: ferredoxin [Novosphingobium sp.]
MRAAAITCSGDADAVYHMLGRTPQCRQCIDEASDILMQERATASLSACA